ncbi:MAG: molybdate ABC transporter substrate-binding protein [Xanthomonadales bacterium]|nr:molybdate ABC transporter substrate-binding protein [Xanthomonadales bacterium]
MGLAHADQPLAGAQAPLIFAAASLKPALDAITASPAGQAQAQVQLSYAASSQLARQIDHGAPADVFISADQRWLDWLQERGRIDVASRIDLLGNALVLVAPTGRFSTPLSLMPGVDLARLLGADGRIALAETNNVPAGRYAREALTRLGMWQTLEPRIVAAENVRAALNFAVRGEVPLAVVYRSDARSTGAVDVLATFPADSHTPIVYPAARLRNGPAPVAAARWLALLCSEDSQTIFIAHGFDVLSGCNDVSAADQPHR